MAPRRLTSAFTGALQQTAKLLRRKASIARDATHGERIDRIVPRDCEDPSAIGHYDVLTLAVRDCGLSPKRVRETTGSFTGRSVDEECARFPRCRESVYWLVACLQYSSGLRLLESVRLLVEDLELEHRATLVRDGKDSKDRVAVLPVQPDELIVALRALP